MAKVLRSCALACVLVAVAASTANAQLIPVITKVELNAAALRLIISGSNFMTTPLPRVLIGNGNGRFDDLAVFEVTPTSIVTGLPDVVPASYRLIAQFGPRGLLIATFDATFGAAGPQGPQGIPGPPGPPGISPPDQSGAIADLRSQVDGLTGRLRALEQLLGNVSRSENDIYITGNLHVVNGMSNTETANGLGNIIIGYNEPGASPNRSGSHNLVLGKQNDYSSYAGVVTGSQNFISAAFASVIGASTLDLRSAGLMKMTSTGAVEFQSASDATLKVGGSLDMRAGINATLKGDAKLLLNGGANGELSSSGPLTIKGSIVNIN